MERDCHKPVRGMVATAVMMLRFVLDPTYHGLDLATTALRNQQLATQVGMPISDVDFRNSGRKDVPRQEFTRRGGAREKTINLAVTEDKPEEISTQEVKSKILDPQLLPRELRAVYRALREIGFVLRVTSDGRVIFPDYEKVDWAGSGLNIGEQKMFARRIRKAIGLKKERTGWMRPRSALRENGFQPEKGLSEFEELVEAEELREENIDAIIEEDERGVADWKARYEEWMSAIKQQESRELADGYAEFVRDLATTERQLEDLSAIKERIFAIMEGIDPQERMPSRHCKRPRRNMDSYFQAENSDSKRTGRGEIRAQLRDIAKEFNSMPV